MKFAILLIGILLLSAALSSCGGIRGDNGELEKVMGISLDPAAPAPGQTVDVTVQWNSSLVHTETLGGGPLFWYRVSAGELIGTDYQPDAEGVWGPVEVRGQSIWIPSDTVKWILPTDQAKAWISAALDSGGQTLVVHLASQV